MLKLCIVFAMIALLTWMRRPLFIAMSGGLAAAAIYYWIPVPDAVGIIGRGAVTAETISVVLSFYLITSLQRMLEMYGRLGQAEEALDDIFHNRGMNVFMAPAAIGLLPLAGALFIPGAIVENSCGGYMSDEDMTFITSFFRHVPESFLPTYVPILLAIMLSGVNTVEFVFFMLLMVATLFGLGYLFMLHKLPVEDKRESGVSRRETWGRFARSPWSIVFIVPLILVFDMPVYAAAPAGITADFLVDRFSVREIPPVFRSTFEPAIIGNTIPVMIFKNVLAYVGVIEEPPVIFSQLPFPPMVIFVMIFFVGTVTSGSQAIIAPCMSIVVVTVPAGGPSLVILLTCMTYAAMQVFPTHICLFIAVEYSGTQMGVLIQRTLPVIACPCAIAPTYAYVLWMVMR